MTDIPGSSQVFQEYRSKLSRHVRHEITVTSFGYRQNLWLTVRVPEGDTPWS